MKPTKARASKATKSKAKPQAAGKRMKRVYFFGGGKAEGNKDMKNLLGGKGANLAEMTNIGVPVPPGFTITTEVCTEFNQAGGKLPKDLDADVKLAVAKMEKLLGKKFGDASNPLLVSVRSGARASMPGMMDTILNLGLNDETAAGLAQASGNERFAYDSYRRFVAMYGDVVLEMKPERKEDHDPFEVILTAKKKAVGVKVDSELPASALKELVGEFKAAIKQHKGIDFPTNPLDQLAGAIKAVFRSWENDRAKVYRKLNNIPSDWGTAVNVQAMVFGNKGNDSATGVCFTRNPSTGENLFYGEFLVNAQGEDVVAGIRTPQKIVDLEKDFPVAYKQLYEIRKKLEKHYKDMQDIEFTVENKKLFMLQCRNGKRTGFAGVRIAVEMVDEKLIGKDEALRRVEPEALNQLLRPVFDGAAKAAAVKEGRLLAKGLPAGPGAATGQIVFFAEDAETWAAQGKTVILCRHETSPEDIRGMNASLGFITAFGGMTSHAALVARQMGKVCIVGCDALSFDYHARTMTVQLGQGHGGSQGRRLGVARRIHRRVHQRPHRHHAVGSHPRAHREEPRSEAGSSVPTVQQADDLGRRRTQVEGARQRRPARPGRGRRGLRRRGHRSLPYRAHVLRRGQDRSDARNDRGRKREGSSRSLGEAVAAAAGRLRRNLPCHG